MNIKSLQAVNMKAELTQAEVALAVLYASDSVQVFDIIMKSGITLEDTPYFLGCAKVCKNKVQTVLKAKKGK